MNQALNPHERPSRRALADVAKQVARKSTARGTGTEQRLKLGTVVDGGLREPGAVESGAPQR
jgi:hypothetical protein